MHVALDFHVHIPSGAVSKDGSAAGVTVAAALISELTGRAVRRDTAMTGEITLQGRVLRASGVKEKVLAAHRAGMKRFVMPLENEKDLHDIPASALRNLEVVFATDMQEVVNATLRT